MPSREFVLEPDMPMSVSEAAAVTQVEPVKINRFIDDGVLPDYAFTKAVRDRSVSAFACPIISFYSSESGGLLTKKAKRDVADSLAEKLKKYWGSIFANSVKTHNFHHITSVVIRNHDFDYKTDSMILDLNTHVKFSLENLNKLAASKSHIIEDPDIRGGIPVMKGTRISPYEAAGVALTDGMDAALEDYPNLTREKIEIAILYARAYPPIGRPKKKEENWRKEWRLVSNKTVPLSKYST